MIRPGLPGGKAFTEGTTELAYDFDPAGRRVRREERVAGSVVDVDRWQVAPTGVDELESPHVETDDSGAEQRAWVFAGEHPLLRYDPTTDDVVYYLSDAMGSVIGLVDDAGAAGTVHYDGFGNERATTGALASVAGEGDFRFQGMWLDGDSGLYYVRARVYEAQSGRFLSRDPAEGVMTGADTYWTYAFAADSPVVGRDPTGRFFTASDGVAVNVGLQTLANLAMASLRAMFTARLQTLVVAGVIVCAANTLLSPTGSGPCQFDGGRRLYHYTNDLTGFEARGATPLTFWAEVGNLEPWEAWFDLGLGRPGMADPEWRVPTHIVESPRDGRFRRSFRFRADSLSGSTSWRSRDLNS